MDNNLYYLAYLFLFISCFVYEKIIRTKIVTQLVRKKFNNTYHFNKQREKSLVPYSNDWDSIENITAV